MDYRFTAILILMLSALAFFAEPAYPKNEYLNEYGVRCGELEVRTDKEKLIIIILTVALMNNNI